MPATAFSHINLRAPRALLDEMRSFYCDVVGLTDGRRPPFRTFGYWLYCGGEPVLHLAELSEGDARELRARNTFDHVAFACTNLGAFESRLKALGIAYKAARVPHSSQVQLFLRDPAENGVELNFDERDEAREDLRTLDQEGAEAVRISDAEVLDRLYASDHLLHYAPAKLIRSREQVLADVREGRLRYESFTRIVEHASEHGLIGITMGAENGVTSRHPIHGTGSSVHRRYTHVWRIEDGHWRLLVRHASDAEPR